ncbi:hypothetical protein GLYMA_03G240651v4 [Glycine max]|uniref:Glutathione synthetase, chloroplastic n=1 Tax=Glycine soja TaxID=3848 RepID=A0A445LGE5_GLYSO|nr:glutathione synthetase, chloroplastic-like [Glycine max]XP_028223841.1 glutathione synthetase, chloroplastic-like [Glycine soja]KAG4394137.1 hypothetical protein GLYMA_03G240651v4 [Glycine max]KAG5056124.1 hypothetical protein JHK85_008634 [Glycine max]RZC22250.1 Glutathione synthetase, chloroplastic [Glycine soja]|eukprot:XP_006577259.1 glutathione synthetase, chloroplastic-like [Glycine max]
MALILLLFAMALSEPLTLTPVQDSPLFDCHRLDQQFLHTLAYDALVWSPLHGLLVGDKSVQRSGSVPGVGLVHAPLALLPTPFPEKQCREATELDAKFLQESLSRLITWLFLNAELKTRMSTKVRGELIPVLNFALRNK